MKKSTTTEYELTVQDINTAIADFVTKHYGDSRGKSSSVSHYIGTEELAPGVSDNGRPTHVLKGAVLRVVVE